MGCGTSGGAKQTQPTPVTQGQIIQDAPQAGYSAPPQTKGTGKGKGKGGGKHTKAQKFQIKLGDKFEDYGDDEDRILKRAYLVGQPNVRFSLRGQSYEYSFRKMVQKNLGTQKERQIRAPPGPKPPKQALLPTGAMTILTVQAGQPGQMIQIKDPNNKGSTFNVYVPPHAKPGSKMAVPVPSAGESIEQVQMKQKKHEETSWSTGAKVVAGGAGLVGLGAVGVGGVLLGDHLMGGEMAADVGAAMVDGGEAVGDAVVDAGEAVADWAPDAVEDLGEFAGDAVDWLGDAGEDVGDFIMDLF